MVAVVAIGSGNEPFRVDDQGAPGPSRSRNSSASRPLTASDTNDPMNSKGSTSLASLSSRCASADGSTPSRSARCASRRSASSSTSTTKRAKPASLRHVALVLSRCKAREALRPHDPPGPSRTHDHRLNGTPTSTRNQCPVCALPGKGSGRVLEAPSLRFMAKGGEHRDDEIRSMILGLLVAGRSIEDIAAAVRLDRRHDWRWMA